MSLTLPKNLDFLDIKKNSYPSRSQRRIFNSTNQATFTGSKTQIIRINLNAGWAEYLDPDQSYLMFKVTNTAVAPVDGDATVTIDGDINCIFSRMEVYHNSRQIEDINNYNVLAQLLKDLYTDANKRDNVKAIMSGSYLDGESIASNESRTFLVRPLLGLLNHDKYLYLGGLNGDLELRLTLENAATAFVNGASYTVEDVKYIGQIITLDSSAQQIIDAMTMQNGGVLSFASESYTNHQTIKQTNDKTMAALVPFRNASLKSIYVTHREQAQTTAAASRSVGKRVTGGVTEYQFDVNGDMTLPVSYDTDNRGEVLMELLRSIHNSSALYPSLIYGVYGDDNNNVWDDNGVNCKFAIGQELETFQNSDSAISGQDTSNATIYFRSKHGDYTSTVVDFFGMYDVVYSIVDGELMARM
jgi:hypothetical protein